MAEAVYVIVFLGILFFLSSLRLRSPWGLVAVLAASVIGVVTGISLFGERYRGRWLKCALAAVVGLLIGVGIEFLRHTQ